MVYTLYQWQQASVCITKITMNAIRENYSDAADTYRDHVHETLYRALMYRFAVHPEQFPWFEFQNGSYRLNATGYNDLQNFATFCSNGRAVSSDPMELRLYYEALCHKFKVTPDYSE